MDFEEFKRHIGKAGLTTREFAELLSMNRNSISNYAATGKVPSHLAVIAALMGEMAEQRVDFRTVLSKITITPNRPRGRPIQGREAEPGEEKSIKIAKKLDK